MPASALQLFALLFAAHVVGDFVLQTERDVRNKLAPSVLAKHALLHAIVTVALIGRLDPWLIPLVILISHAILDYAKARWAGPSATAFIVDQAAHLLVLAALALAFRDEGTFGWGTSLGIGASYTQGLILFAGLIVNLRAGAFLIAKFVRPYDEELRATIDGRPVSLTNAGNTIGKLERLLIYVMVMMGQPGAIGFLIAAKSIFRFGELKEAAKRMESEYIIIGTLASFAFAICVSFAMRALVLAVAA